MLYNRFFSLSPDNPLPDNAGFIRVRPVLLYVELVQAVGSNSDCMVVKELIYGRYAAEVVIATRPEFHMKDGTAGLG